MDTLPSTLAHLLHDKALDDDENDDENEKKLDIALGEEAVDCRKQRRPLKKQPKQKRNSSKTKKTAADDKQAKIVLKSEKDGLDDDKEKLELLQTVDSQIPGEKIRYWDNELDISGGALSFRNSGSSRRGDAVPQSMQDTWNCSCVIYCPTTVFNRALAKLPRLGATRRPSPRPDPPGSLINVEKHHCYQTRAPKQRHQLWRRTPRSVPAVQFTHILSRPL